MRRLRRLWRGVRRWLVGAGLAGALAIGWVVAVPFPADRLQPGPEIQSRRLLDRHGRLLQEALNDHQGRGAWRELPEVGPWLPRAFVAIEDHRFASHWGLDPIGIGRAAWANLRAGRIVAGGSTLTQQVVERLLPQPRTLWGKLIEAVWALRLERAVSKDAILTQYLNRVPFGHGTFGVEAAARLYLGKPARALSLGEAALLAGIPRAPSINNPISDPERAQARQIVVLQRMRALGLVTPQGLERALAEPLHLHRPRAVGGAPHFAAFVLQRGAPPGEVRTTLDLTLQGEVEAAVDQTLRELDDRAVGQAAAVVLDNASGEVLAWVGSRNFFDPHEGQVDMVRRRRQPGSTLKPFVYGLALERGFTAASRLPDLPIFFPTLLGVYSPRNYDRRYHGWVSLRAALANSYNVPAVWLTDRLGLTAVYERLRAAGFDSLRHAPAWYGLGLALGNGEVTLLELANAYRALANEGLWRPIRWRLNQPPAATERRMMSVAAARLITDILADSIARAPAFGRDNALEMDYPAAAKTGTSADFTDNWTVGYTPEVTVAAWTGNFDGAPMQAVSGLTGAGSLWHRVLRAAMKDRPRRPFSRTGLVRASVGPISELFVQGTRPPLHPEAPAPLVRAPLVRAPLVRAPLVRAPLVRAPLVRAPLVRAKVRFPNDGDVFALDPDVPQRLASLRLEATLPPTPVPSQPVWEIDGAPAQLADGLWPARAGSHTLRVWPRAQPELASPPVRFEVRE